MTVEKNNMPVLGMASDHAGYQMKLWIKAKLRRAGYVVKDFGCDSDESCDYPDYAHPLAKALENEEIDFGFSLCGSGNGINMVVNKHQFVRSALCWNVDIARLAREHNNANICALPARFVENELAWEMVEAFLQAEFEGGRHTRRINKIPLK